ncbi:hypothetical protein Dimus_027195 [Dionaea muscipula]
MMEHGLRNVMEVIKRQKWESLFKRRELVHVDSVKEFYAKLTMSHNRKKDVARSKVRGVEIVFDHLKLASILGVPGNNGICEYIKEKETTPSGVDPSGPSGRILEAVMNKLQAEFERARANRFQADLEKAQAENARLLALLQQAKNPPKP